MSAIAGLSVAIMVVLVTSDVVMRALFRISILGVDAVVASYLMIATIFLPLAMVGFLEEHITVDALHYQASNVIKNLFDLVGHLLSFVLYSSLAFLYFKTAIESYEIREYITGTWNVPIWPARIIMPIGLGLAGVAAVVKLALIARALHAGSNPTSSNANGTI